MRSPTFTFARIGPGRYLAFAPNSKEPAGTVSGRSNNWRAERPDGSVINNAYATRQHAARALR